MPALSDQNEPSLSSQIAVTFWESASRMRVATLARPARGPRWKLTTLGWGFFSVKTCTALTCWASVIGLSTVTVSGTALPFSMSGGRSSFTLPGVTRADPTTLRMASCISAGVALAGGDDRAATHGIALGARERLRDRILSLRHTQHREDRDDRGQHHGSTLHRQSLLDPVGVTRFERRLCRRTLVLGETRRGPSRPPSMITRTPRR